MKSSAVATFSLSFWGTASLWAQELPEDFGNPWMSKLVELEPPPPVPWWPPAPGWYLLAGLAVALLGYLLWTAWRRWRSNAYRRQALRRLAAIEELAFAPNSRRSALPELPVLLKQTALAAYPRTQVAHLSAHQWLRFLDGSMGTNQFRGGPGKLVAELAYAPAATQRLEDTEMRELFAVTRKWIQSHDRRFRVAEAQE